MRGLRDTPDTPAVGVGRTIHQSLAVTAFKTPICGGVNQCRRLRDQAIGKAQRNYPVGTRIKL